MRGLLRSPLAVLLAGAAHTFSFAPFEAWWLQCLALAVLAHAAQGAGVRRAALLGWLFALGWLVAGFWWLYISMHDYGGMAAPLAALAVLALAAALALYYAAALAVWAGLRPRAPGAVAACLDAATFSACWLLAELGRATLFTGFPWIASGYAHAVGPLAAGAPWVGVYGLCALGALVSWAIAAPFRPATTVAPRWAPVGLVFLLLATVQALPHEFSRPAGEIEVSLLQPNVAQDLKFDPTQLGANLDDLLAQIRAARGRLVVTPESVVPMTRDELGDAWWADLRSVLAQPGRGLLLGIFTGNETAGFVNSVIGWSNAAGAAEYRYGKRHLLPFGEFVPLGFRWFVDLMAIPLADQAHGSSSASFEIGGQRLRPLVCYEDLFGEDIVESVVGPHPATIFVNVSNLAWFGRRLVQDQHLQFSQMRAIEFQRPVIRSTNTGATAVVDHRGVISARLAPETAGILEARVEGRTGETPYARWLATAGLWPLLVLALAALGGAALHRGRRAAAS